MAGKTNKVDVLALVSGEGTLTATEGQALASQYRTADRAEALASLHKGRIAYVVKSRGVADADGKPVALADLAKSWGVSAASITQGHTQYATVVFLGLHTESDAVQREAYAAATALRKISAGRDEGAVKAFDSDKSAALADVRALPVGERVEALRATLDTLKASAAEHRKAGAPSVPSAQSTPETSGEAAFEGKAAVLSALGAIVNTVAANGVALTNGESAQVARYLAAIARDLGVDLAEVAALAAA